MIRDKDMNGDSILVFTRMPREGFDEFMGNPEAVIDTVEDMGFDQELMMQSMTRSGDPGQILGLMEERWSGEGMNFAFEGFWPFLLRGFPGSSVLKMIMDDGRRSQIYTEHGCIRVLSQDQVMRARDGLAEMDMGDVDTVGDEEADLMLEDLFPALQRFFSLAAGANEFVLVSHI